MLVGAFGFHATSAGEFLLTRSLFYGSALLLAGTIFVVQWMAPRPTTWSWIIGAGCAGFVIFAGLAACIGWADRKEAAIVSEARPPQQPQGNGTRISAPENDAKTPVSGGQPTRTHATNRADAAKDEGKTTFPPPVVTFRNGRARVSLSVSYHVEPSDAPLAVVTFGEIREVPDKLNSKVMGVAFAVLEPLSLQEARAHRADLERTIRERLRDDLKKLGITIDSVSLGAIEPI